ncbi:hypothetical protein CDAR_604761 [Caerostris darwini]|uniref:Uncharacterized protein n=1 Tax=Caerostris darwini TaxID=1538125 RepID=A0AAV4QWT5_9ARAC|nr:hypothetical protein CDAR_604761 [Caerostris darwini]
MEFFLLEKHGGKILVLEHRCHCWRTSSFSQDLRTTSKGYLDDFSGLDGWGKKREGSALETEIKTYDQCGKSARNEARKNAFFTDRRRINCCIADKKTVKVKNSFCVGWAKAWMMVSPGGSWNA